MGERGEGGEGGGSKRAPRRAVWIARRSVVRCFLVVARPGPRLSPPSQIMEDKGN